MAEQLADRKRMVIAKKARQRADRRAVRRVHHQCFWTWPLGHRWESMGSGGYGWDDVRCVGCGWERRRWYD